MKKSARPLRQRDSLLGGEDEIRTGGRQMAGVEGVSAPRCVKIFCKISSREDLYIREIINLRTHVRTYVKNRMQALT